jgi:hypothetical protein
MNKYIKIAIIIFSSVIILWFSYKNSFKEGLTNKNNILLLGDSVLDNSIYVLSDQSVESRLTKHNSNVYNFAKDGSTIIDLYAQLDKAPLSLNKQDTYAFISIGGNNILHDKSQSITELFNTFSEFLKSFRVKFGSVKLNIFNIYMPANPKYKSYVEAVDQWNKLLQDNSNKIGEMYNIIDVHSLLTSPSDFVYDIEPSSEASEKIANAILLAN